MATIARPKSKRTRPKIIELDEPITNTNETTAEPKSVNTSETTRILSDSRSDSQVVTINDTPSAPPEGEYEYRPTSLTDGEVRANFMAKVFAVLFVQKLSFTAMLMLFTFVPHMRKVVRKNIFDKLFLGSFIGYPLFIIPMVLMIVSQTIRRKLAKISFTLLTMSLALLLSYAITQPKTSTAFLYSMGMTNICDLGVIMGSKMKRDFTKWRYISLVPAFLTASSVLAPSILRSSLNYTIWPSIATTVGSSYLMANTRPVIKYNDLDIKPDEYVFAAIQLHLNPEQWVRHKIKEWFFGSERPDRRGYTEINS